MNNELKEKILNNTFVNKVRNEMHIDEEQYDELCRLLEELSNEWKDKQVVDKELVLDLYSMSQIVRNTFLSFKKHNEPILDIAKRLEDIGVEIDALDIDCLS